MSDIQAINQFQTSTIKGFLILAIGLAFFFAVHIPQLAILAVMNTDLLTALYLSLEHGVLDACFVLAAFYLMTAVLARRATLVDMGLMQFPFLEKTSTRGLSMLVSGAPQLLMVLALILFGGFILLIVQRQWELLLQNAFHLIAPVNNWGLPDLWQQKKFFFFFFFFFFLKKKKRREERRGE